MTTTALISVQRSAPKADERVMRTVEGEIPPFDEVLSPELALVDSRQTRKPLDVQASRGFKSLPLRFILRVCGLSRLFVWHRIGRLYRVLVPAAPTSTFEPVGFLTEANSREVDVAARRGVRRVPCAAIRASEPYQPLRRL